MQVVGFMPRSLYFRGGFPRYRYIYIIVSRRGHRNGLDGMEKRKIPCLCRESNLESCTDQALSC
jgi:hypothetical protein